MIFSTILRSISSLHALVTYTCVEWKVMPTTNRYVTQNKEVLTVTQSQQWTVFVTLTLGQVIPDQLLEKVRRSRFFGLLCDDVTDIAVLQQFIAFIQFVDPQSGEDKRPKNRLPRPWSCFSDPPGSWKGGHPGMWIASQDAQTKVRWLHLHFPTCTTRIKPTKQDISDRKCELQPHWTSHWTCQAKIAISLQWSHST